MQWAQRLSPTSAEYHRRLSNAYVRNGSLGKALKEQEEVLEARRDFAPDEVRLGWLLWFGRDLQGAGLAFERAVGLDRWDTTRADVHMALGLSRAAATNYEGARAAFSYGFSVSPTMLADPAWVQTEESSSGVTYLDPAYLQALDQGLPNDLQRDILRRLDLPSRRPPVGPPSTANDYSLAAVLDQMRRDYEALLRTDGARAEALLGTMGQLALRGALPQEAIAYYQELVERQPDDETVQYALGLAYIAAGENERAEDAFNKVLALTEDEGVYVLREPFSHFQLGRIALERQPPDIPGARREFQQARDTYRWSYMPLLYPYLALAEALSGDTDAARAALDKELYLRAVDDPGGSRVHLAVQAEETARDLAR